MWNALGVGDDIKKGVDAVAEVDVGNAAGEKHGFCAFGSPIVEGMRRAVFGAGVGLGFGDDASC